MLDSPSARLDVYPTPQIGDLLDTLELPEVVADTYPTFGGQSLIARMRGAVTLGFAAQAGMLDVKALRPFESPPLPGQGPTEETPAVDTLGGWVTDLAADDPNGWRAHILDQRVNTVPFTYVDELYLRVSLRAPTERLPVVVLEPPATVEMPAIRDPDERIIAPAVELDGLAAWAAVEGPGTERNASSRQALSPGNATATQEAERAVANAKAAARQGSKVPWDQIKFRVDGT